MRRVFKEDPGLGAEPRGLAAKYCSASLEKQLLGRIVHPPLIGFEYLLASTPRKYDD